MIRTVARQTPNQTSFIPTRAWVQTLSVGQLAPSCFGKWLPVVAITYAGDDVNGHAYVGVKLDFGPGSTISSSYKEGEAHVTVDGSIEPMPGTEPTPPVPAFTETLDGDTTIAFFPFEAAGCFLGVQRFERRIPSPFYGLRPLEVLYFAPMNADGSADRDNIGEVENIEGLDLDDVNAFFGSHFTVEEFERRR